MRTCFLQCNQLVPDNILCKSFPISIAYILALSRIAIRFVSLRRIWEKIGKNTFLRYRPIQLPHITDFITDVYYHIMLYVFVLQTRLGNINFLGLTSSLKDYISTNLRNVGKY